MAALPVTHGSGESDRGLARHHSIIQRLDPIQRHPRPDQWFSINPRAATSPTDPDTPRCRRARAVRSIHQVDPGPRLIVRSGWPAGLGRGRLDVEPERGCRRPRCRPRPSYSFSDAGLGGCDADGSHPGGLGGLDAVPQRPRRRRHAGRLDPRLPARRRGRPRGRACSWVKSSADAIAVEHGRTGPTSSMVSWRLGLGSPLVPTASKNPSRPLQPVEEVVDPVHQHDPGPSGEVAVDKFPSSR